MTLFMASKPQKQADSTIKTAYIGCTYRRNTLESRPKPLFNIAVTGYWWRWRGRVGAWYMNLYQGLTCEMDLLPIKI